MTAFLIVAHRQTGLPPLWAAQIAEALRTSGCDEIVDLGSGAGGPIGLVAGRLRELGCDARITLTDLYPNERDRQTDTRITYWPEAADARAVPAALTGLRTMFASFHHFKPADGKAILRDAFEQRRPICIFEVTSRTPLAIGLTLLMPLFVLKATASIRPVSVFQLVFTYVIPLLPLLIFWDGFASQWRTYSAAELLGMTEELRDPAYRWTSGVIGLPGLPLGVPYLTGCPVSGTVLCGG